MDSHCKRSRRAHVYIYEVPLPLPLHSIQAGTFCSEHVYNVQRMASVSASFVAGQEIGLVEKFHTCVLAYGSPFNR